MHARHVGAGRRAGDRIHPREIMNALVTGGTKGIGFAIAQALAAAGGKVMITGRDGARVTDAAAVLAKSAAPGGSVVGVVADVRDRAAIDAAVDRAAAAFGSLDTLINNAGVGVFRSVEGMSDDDWHAVIDTNLTGVFYATRAAIPHLKRAGGGWIINIASLAGRNYFANAGAYCASKAGLVAFSEAVMLEVRNDNIRVSCVMPGSVATEFSGPGKHEDESWKLTGEDIAEVVMDLLRHPKRSLPSKVEIRPARTS
jgi:NAD(P)-dependent dehydrogenase (short-subunit alcohol dehydrogenase family)